MKLTELNDYLIKASTTLHIYKEERTKLNASLKLYNSKLDVSLKIRELIYVAVNQTQSQIKYHLSNLVSMGLGIVFPEKEYIFSIDFLTRRSQTECDFLLSEKGTENTGDPKYRNGGGVLDIISLTLRMACWSLSNASDTLVLDEPSKFVSKNKQELVVQMIRQIASELHIQCIIVSHIPEFANQADNIITIHNGNKLLSIKKFYKSTPKRKRNHKK